MADKTDKTPDTAQEQPQAVPYERFAQVVQARRAAEAKIQELQAQVQQLHDVQAQVAQAQREAQLWRTAAQAGLPAEPELVEAVGWAYERATASMEPDKRPDLASWVAAQREDPAKAHPVLRPWLQPPAAPQQQEQKAEKTATTPPAYPQQGPPPTPEPPPSDHVPEDLEQYRQRAAEYRRRAAELLYGQLGRKG